MNKLEILIVDDNRDLADCLALLLREEQHRVTVAYNGEDAVTEIRQNPYHLAIIDIKLPGISGIEVFRTMNREKPEIQGIIMTGYYIEQVIAELTGESEVAVLRHPIQMQELKDKIMAIEAGGIVVLADGNPGTGAGAEQYLSQQGYAVMLIEEGDEFNAAGINRDTDVLILDWKLPIIRGLDIYLDLMEQGNALPTVIVAGTPDQQQKNPDILRSMSVTGCLFKPFNPEDLLTGIDTLYN